MCVCKLHTLLTQTLGLVTAPDTAVAASPSRVTLQRVIFFTRIIRESTVGGSVVQQRDSAILQIQQRAAVDDCENIRKI